MNKADLLKILDTIPYDAEIEISIDVSDPKEEATGSDRIFALRVNGVAHRYANLYTILATGSRNFY